VNARQRRYARRHAAQLEAKWLRKVKAWSDATDWATAPGPWDAEGKP